MPPMSAAFGGSDEEERQERYEAAIDEKDRLVRSLRVNNYHSLADHPRISVVDGTACRSWRPTPCA